MNRNILEYSRRIMQETETPGPPWFLSLHEYQAKQMCHEYGVPYEPIDHKVIIGDFVIEVWGQTESRT